MIQLPKDILANNDFVHVRRLGKMYGIWITSANTFKDQNLLQTTHCLELVLEGSVEIRYGSAIQKLHPDQVQFRKRGNYQVLPSKDYKSLLLFMENEFILSFLKQHVDSYNRHELDYNLPPFLFPRSEFININARHIIRHIISQGDYSACNVKITTHQILLQILAMDTSKRFVTFLKYLVDDQKIDLPFFMESYFLQHMSLKERARLAGRSISSFKREFMELFHTTPGKWLINRRLDYADHLLKHSTDQIAGIAFTCGFESPSHFSKVYKNKFGISPRQKKRVTFVKQFAEV